MASNWPASLDNFNIPSSPGTTALSSAGTGSRNHVQHHRDLGDAIEVMQAEATLLVHSHDGSTARHGSKLDQDNTHESADTDSAPSSIHHTLGHGANQSAPGDHAALIEFEDTHAGAVAWPVGSIFMTTTAGNPSGDFGGTWVQIQDSFLIGAGGSYTYTGSVVPNVTTHTHTIADTSSAGSHSHTIATPTGDVGVHSHSVGSTGSASATHSHSAGGSGQTHSAGSSGGNSALTNHSAHSLNSKSSSHSHSGGALNNSAANHNHTIGSTSDPGSHSHTATASSPSHLPPWLAIYTWQRTA